MSYHKFIIFVSCFLFFIASFTFAQEEEAPEIKTAPENGAEAVYVISSFVFNIDGITRTYALINKAELTAGEEITGLSALQNYIREKRQLLYNERVLESVKIEYTIDALGEDGKYPVNLVIDVKDTWNIIAIPRPQYSSNTGFDITIKARDYNFLGTMSPLRIDLGYQHDTEGRNFYSLMLDSNIPFRLFNLNWNFNFDHFYTFRPDLDKHHYYQNNTGLSVELPLKTSIITIGFTESFIINEENDTRYRSEYGRFQEGLYLSSQPYISWRIPTGFFYYDLGEIYYTPRLSAAFNHELPQWPLADFRKGPFLTFSHNITFGRIDWNDNFQRGAAARINHSISYNFYNLRNDIEPWTTNINIRGIGHRKISNFIGISSCIMYRQWFFDDNYTDEGGDVLRGILDNKIIANSMLSVNFDVSFKILNFNPYAWLNNKYRFLRIFEFELHTAPFVDAAFYNDPINQKVFGLENLLLTGGLEAIIFPARWRSLFLRISYGRNFSVGPKSNNSEIFIGTELHY